MQDMKEKFDTDHGYNPEMFMLRKKYQESIVNTDDIVTAVFETVFYQHYMNATNNT